MKLYGPRGEEITVTWADHWPGCEPCRGVDLQKPATLANACAQGAPLTMEELAKRQAPVEKHKRKAVEEWARERGTFVTHKNAHVATKYKE